MEDNIEKLFRKKLRDDVPKDENWNTPSDDLWDRASLEFTRDKKRRRPIWILFGLIGVLAIGLGYSLFHIQNLNEKVAALEAPILTNVLTNENQSANNSSKINLIQQPAQSNVINKSNVLNEENIKKETSLTSSNSIVGNTSIETTGQLPLEHKEIAAQKANTNNHLSSSKTTIANVIPSNTTTNGIDKAGDAINNKSSFIPGNINHSNTALATNMEQIDGLPFRSTSLSYDRNLTLSSMGLNLSPNDVKSKVDKRFIVGLFAGPSLTAAPVTDNPSGDFKTLIGSEGLNKSFNYGGTIGMKILPNLYIKSGLNYQVVKYWSQSEMIASYDKSTEFINDAGEMENIQNLNFASATGMLESTVSLTHPTNIRVDQGEAINGIMDLHQNLHYLSIPFGVEYIKELPHNFSLTGGIGMSYNRLLNVDNIITSVMDKAEIKMDVETMETKHSIKSNIANYNLSLGVQYSISDDYQINVQGTYFENVSNIFKSDQMSSKLHGYNLQFGINRKF